MQSDGNIIDAHTHVAPRWADMAVRVMDAAGIACSVTLGWQDAFGDALDNMLASFGRYPGRFAQLANIDWRGIDDAGWGEARADELERAVDAGAAGLKIFKALGLEVRDKSGELIRVDDRRLDPVFHRAGKLGAPVLLHAADPVWFWRPLDERNFWRGVLEGGYEHWMYYRTGGPGREELLGERDGLVARHPDTVFVAPHLASLADDPLEFEETLQRHPNVCADISARLPAMVRTSRRRGLWRQILTDFADRILFGTDLIYLDGEIEKGIQSQSFQLPEDLDPHVPETNEERYERTSVEYALSHVEFLASDAVQPRAPFRRVTGSFALAGLGLAPDVVRRIVWDTPRRVYGLG